LEDIPEHKLIRGQVGTVVEKWAYDVYEVEFADKNGVTTAMVAVQTRQLLELHMNLSAESA
ncbi:MAG: DUF4926 domain-containing protein, partial [Anaerolineae bacterium]|nr:DUF4926 domain-containing protein [Anaerolineae bacterium]